jgi:diacylglycerol kinase family enzyme
MTGTVTDLAVRSLSGTIDLRVERTQYRGHAGEIAAAARDELVIVLGGDGSINEVINGLMHRNSVSGEAVSGEAESGEAVSGEAGSRALGLPADAAEAIRRVRDVIEEGKYRTVGLGLAGDRYFTFSAGLGMDAEVVHEVEKARAAGRKESASLFLRTMVRHLYRGTDRRTPALTLERDGQPTVRGLFVTIITNRSPWTYYRGRAVLPVPNPDFNSGLDVLALRRVSLTTIYGAVLQMLLIRKRPPRGRNLTAVHGAESLTVRSARPIAFQVDGEYLGEVEEVKFQFIPHALRVVA